VSGEENQLTSDLLKEMAVGCSDHKISRVFDRIICSSNAQAYIRRGLFFSPAD